MRGSSKFYPFKLKTAWKLLFYDSLKKGCDEGCNGSCDQSLVKRMTVELWVRANMDAEDG